MPEIAIQLSAILTALNTIGTREFLEAVALESGCIYRKGQWVEKPGLDPTPWVYTDDGEPTRHAHTRSLEDRYSGCEFHPEPQYIQDVSPYLVKDNA